ncbi:MAG: DUF1738 domain-containing protein [Saprospiraceae bacterium]|nr:DUF1738 domain-containing protein [Saprospiraceae bacterium]
MKSTTEPKVQKSTNTTLYEDVTLKIIALIEKGITPWRQTWSTYGLARNYVSGRLYSGINYLLLNNTKHSIPYFLTFSQIKALGGIIKAGSESEMVIYFKVYYKDSDDRTLTKDQAMTEIRKGKEIKILRFIRHYNVFNISDIEKVEIDFNKFNEIKLTNNEKIERCEEIINNMTLSPVLKQIDANRAYYDSNNDFINLPVMERFVSSEHYYATYFHELIHSTGHSSRLARPEVMDFAEFGTISYSKEELIAEMGATFLCSLVQIDSNMIFQNSASYLSGWLKVLKEDPKFIFKVSAEAQKAVDYVLNF